MFPVDKPINTMMHGWLGYGNKEELLRVLNKPQIKTIVELGSWYGKSSEFILKNDKTIEIICVDLWSNSDIKEGNQVIKYNDKYSKILDTYDLYETFLANMWDYQNRVLPVKMDTKIGLKHIHSLGIEPNAIYIDANHTYKDVKGEIELSIKLFPNAILLGDDMNWSGVKRAVIECAKKYNFHLIKNRNCWRYFNYPIPENVLNNSKIKVLC